MPSIAKRVAQRAKKVEDDYDAPGRLAELESLKLVQVKLGPLLNVIANLKGGGWMPARFAAFKKQALQDYQKLWETIDVLNEKSEDDPLRIRDRRYRRGDF